MHVVWMLSMRMTMDETTVVNPMYMYLAWWLLVVIGGVTASGEVVRW